MNKTKILSNANKIALILTLIGALYAVVYGSKTDVIILLICALLFNNNIRDLKSK